MTHPHTPLPRQVIFVRHAESEMNEILEQAFLKHNTYKEALAAAIFKMQDHPHRDAWHLTQKGVTQAKLLGSYLEHRFSAGYFDVVYTSFMRRAMQTQAFAYPNTYPLADVRLNEMERGLFEHADEGKTRKARPLQEVAPLLEPFWTFIEEVLCSGQYTDQKVLIFCHGGIMSSLGIYPPPQLDCRLDIGDGSMSNTGMIIYDNHGANDHLIATEYNTTP